MDSQELLRSEDLRELERLRSQWWCFLLLGLLLIVFGVLALGSAYYVSVAAVIVFGALLLMAGTAQIITAFWAGRWSGFLIHLLTGILYVVAGYLIVDEPLESTVQLTVLLAALFIISGLFRSIAALVMRFPHWGWALLNGVITLLLGIVIYKQLSESGPWIIGVLIGVEMLFNGWSWVMLALGLRSMETGEA